MFDKTSLQAWNRTGVDEFRVTTSQSKGPQTSSLGQFGYNLKAALSSIGGEGSWLRELKGENIASVQRFKNDISSFFTGRANSAPGKVSAYGQIRQLATKQLDYLETGGRRLSDRSIKQVMTHVSTLTDVVDQADENLAKDYSPWVRNEALRQLDMNAILRNAGALDENGNMKRVLTGEEKTKINDGVASQLEELCRAVKENLIQQNNAVWDRVASPQGLNELIGRDERGPISSFRLFGTEAKDQTFFQKAERNINSVKRGLESKWDQEPLDEKALKKELHSEMFQLAKNWGSSMSQSSSFSPPENAQFRDSHPELNDFITFALAQEIQNASPKDDKNNPLMQWKEAYDDAKFDHTLRDEKFAQFLAGRQIDRTNLPAETKIASKEVLGDLVKQGNECLKDNEMYGDKNVDELRESSQSLDSGYSALVQRHNKAESFLQLAKNFHSQTPGLDQLNNSLVAMATRAVTGLKASLDAYETVIKERHESGVEKYGKDIVDLIKSNPERLDLVFRAKDTPIVFEPSMVPRFIDSLQNGTGQQPGDQKTASVCRNAWNLISGQVSDRTLGQQALKDPGAFKTKAHKDDRPFGNMETKRLIEVTKAHETVVDQIQNQLSEVRDRQQTLSKDAPKILHDSLASFANALEKRLAVAAGPLRASREELRDRHDQAIKDAFAFENLFGKDMTELLRKHSGETFEGTPNVGQNQIVSASNQASQAPGFATTEQVSKGMLERLTTRIGQAGKTLGVTDIARMSNTDLGNLLGDVAKLSEELNEDLESIDKALGQLSNSSDNGRVAKNPKDEFLVSFLVAARGALVNQSNAIGPVQRAASQIAAQRSTNSYDHLMPNLSKATSGTPRPKETKSASPSHVSNSICEELKKDPTSGQTLSQAAEVIFRLRERHATAHQKENRQAYDKAMEKMKISVRESKEYKEEYPKVSNEVNGYVDQVKDLKTKLQQIAKDTKSTLGIGGNQKVHNLATALLQDLEKVDLGDNAIQYIVDTLTVLEKQKK